MVGKNGILKSGLLALLAMFFIVLPATIHAQDGFRVLGVTSVEGGMRITWTSVPWHKYSVEVSTGLTNFGSVEGAESIDAAAAPAIETSIVDLADRGPVAFYRVVHLGGVNLYDDLVLILAGSFQMGDTFDEESSSERPVHSVYVSAFYMGKYEVTKALWDEVGAWGATHGYTDLPTGGGKGADHPVHSISWYAMVKWCNARSEREGLTPCYTVEGATYKAGSNAPDCNWGVNGYRLPSEAEWEKAARGGLSGKRFPWGDTITHGQANYYSSSSDSYDVSPTRGYHPTYDDGGTPYSSPVGSLTPNGYGLYDISGNLWEWCWDRWSSSYYGSSPDSDPHGSASGSGRVRRGGSWSYSAGSCRAAVRFNDSPGRSYNYFGFRVARSSSP